MMNSAVYAMKVLQEGMKGEAEKAGLYSDEDIVHLIMEMRAEEKLITQIPLKYEHIQIHEMEYRFDFSRRRRPGICVNLPNGAK